MIGAIFNLDHPAHVVEWHFISLSVANLVVIGLMLVVFALAIDAAVPGRGTTARERTMSVAPPPKGVVDSASCASAE